MTPKRTNKEQNILQIKKFIKHKNTTIYTNNSRLSEKVFKLYQFAH